MKMLTTINSLRTDTKKKESNYSKSDYLLNSAQWAKKDMHLYNNARNDVQPRDCMITYTSKARLIFSCSIEIL